MIGRHSVTAEHVPDRLLDFSTERGRVVLSHSINSRKSMFMINVSLL